MSKNEMKYNKCITGTYFQMIKHSETCIISEPVILNMTYHNILKKIKTNDETKPNPRAYVTRHSVQFVI